MTDFSDFNVLYDNLVAYFTGSYSMLALGIIVFFLVLLMTAGLDVKYSLIFILPLVAFFTTIGWFGSVGDAQWIVNAGLIIVSIIYAYAVLKITS